VNWLDAIDIELFGQHFCAIECSAQLRGQKEVFEQFDVQVQEQELFQKAAAEPSLESHCAHDRREEKHH
jgi:hypothetical protein